MATGIIPAISAKKRASPDRSDSTPARDTDEELDWESAGDARESPDDRTQLRAWQTFITAQASVIDQIERELAQAEQLPLASYDVLLA